jgi:ABC-type dipeptide/oligopeptide/nickel transport system permease component
MLKFLLQRLIGLIFVLIGVTLVTFLMAHYAPGQDPISVILGLHNTPEAHKALAHSYGLDRPAYEQYFSYVIHLLQGNFGLSYQFKGQSVNNVLLPAIAVSATLGLSALILALLLGVPAGILAALRRNSWVDSSVMGVMIFFYAVPAFVIIPFYQVLIDFNVAHNLPNLPVSGWNALLPTGNWFADSLAYKIAPITVLALTNMGYYARISRTVMLEVLGQDYVRTARSKGLAERRVVYLHAFRNAMLPLLSVIGPSLAFLVTGSFVVEVLFNVPGVGYQGVQAVFSRDWPVLQGTVVILATAVVLMNLITDILYGVADPRIRIS